MLNVYIYLACHAASLLRLETIFVATTSPIFKLLALVSVWHKVVLKGTVITWTFILWLKAFS